MRDVTLPELLLGGPQLLKRPDQLFVETSPFVFGHLDEHLVQSLGQPDADLDGFFTSGSLGHRARIEMLSGEVNTIMIFNGIEIVKSGCYTSMVAAHPPLGMEHERIQST